MKKTKKSAFMANYRRFLFPLASVLLFVFVLVVLVRNAWIGDDGFIILRTVDNFVNGYGLTFNVVERVQTFTCPLFVFFLSIPYFFFQNGYLVAILSSIFLSFFSIFLFFLFSKGVHKWHAVLGVLLLLSSKAFVDYGVSGLENPLSYLIIVLFFIFFFKEKLKNRLFILTFLTSLAALNRLDNVLLFLPALVFVFVTNKRYLKDLFVLFLGFLPLGVWLIFSLFYFGFLFPNTYFAKLGATQIPLWDFIAQGYVYLRHSFVSDFVTLPVIIFSFFVAIYTKEWKRIVVLMGVFLQLLYVFRIGGDFMSGRFLTSMFFVSMILIFSVKKWDELWKYILITMILFQMVFHFSVFPWFSGYPYLGKVSRDPKIGRMNVIDEKAFYAKGSSFERFLSGEKVPEHEFMKKFEEFKGNKYVNYAAIGMLGYYSKQGVYIFDKLALSDVLMARLPAIQVKDNVPGLGKYGRVGHLERIVPKGYEETLIEKVNVLYKRDLKNYSYVSGLYPNLIDNMDLAFYYDKLDFIISGKLWDKNRIIEIVKMNLGLYDEYLERYLQSLKS
jgi:arabinofuranosyltransferase